tara:strand:+ start:265 stop:696 length:432 start_codon:yes stop_codon:yes gene_type:complete
MSPMKFKPSVLCELTAEDHELEFKLKRDYFEKFHCWFSDCNKYGVFANGTVKLTNKSRLRASCGNDFINQWSDCDDKRTLVDPYQYGYVPNTKNREYCAKWREANYEKWTNINRSNALKRRVIKINKEVNTPPQLIAEIMSFL